MDSTVLISLLWIVVGIVVVACCELAFNLATATPKAQRFDGKLRDTHTQTATHTANSQPSIQGEPLIKAVHNDKV